MWSGARPVRPPSADRDMLRPPVRVRTFDQDFVRPQREVPMRQMHRKAIEFAVPGKHVADFSEAIEIAVIDGRHIGQVRKPRPLHRQDRNIHFRAPCHARG